MNLKRLFALIMALCSSGLLSAAPLTTETPINSFPSQTCVSVSTSAWTAIPATTNGTRTAVNVSNSGSTTVYIGADNTKAITVPGAIIPTLGNFGLQLSGAIQLYAVSLVSAGTVCVWEGKQ